MEDAEREEKERSEGRKRKGRYKAENENERKENGRESMYRAEIDYKNIIKEMAAYRQGIDSNSDNEMKNNDNNSVMAHVSLVIPVRRKMTRIMVIGDVNKNDDCDNYNNVINTGKIHNNSDSNTTNDNDNCDNNNISKNVDKNRDYSNNDSNHHNEVYI